MIWVELICDKCNESFNGGSYSSGTIKRLRTNAKASGWKTIKGKMLCPNCQMRIKIGSEEK